MTSRSKNAVRSYETEIEKCREESNWKKAVELAQQLKTRSPQRESLAHFLIGEGKLECYLDEYPPGKENIERAQRELSEAKGYLTLATDEAGKRDGVALDAHLLLGKLNYSCGNYDEALKHYKCAELSNLTEKELPVRSLRIVAESNAIKGLCLEQNALPSSTSRYKQAEKETEIVRNFEVSSELSLLYLQRGTGPAGALLETALQRAPLLHVRAGRLQQAIDRYRLMLSAVESGATQALRLALARQLAELLMRAVSGQVYKPPTAVSAVPQAGTLTRRREEYASDGPWKPKKYAAINQFVPRTEQEEVMLVLLVGEAMAVRDAVLSQSAEFEVARVHSLRNAVALIDLLALPAARWGQLCLVTESLERAMKFSFGSAHVWRQRALAAAAPLRHNSAGGGGAGAAGVLRRAATLNAQDAPLRLVAATTLYNMGQIEEGIEMAESALALAEQQSGAALARCCLYAGVGHQMRAQKTNSRVEKDAANDVCLKLLVRAVQLDDNDHLAFYYLATQYMNLGMLNEAMDATRSCLSARACCSGGLRLCAALWSCACAGGRGPRALAAARLARLHRPAAEWPLWALAALQVVWETGEAALATGKELLMLLNSAESELEADQNGYTELDALSDSQVGETHSNKDAASIRAECAGAYRAERALSEGASSASARAPPALSHRRAHAWLLLADLCLRLDRVGAAAGCVAEAAALTPFNHLVLYTRGAVHAARAEWEEARRWFVDALALHPAHVDSLVQLGGAQLALGWPRLAERSLREALALEPARADAWRRLALVLLALREPHAAADAAAAALALNPRTPATPHPYPHPHTFTPHSLC